MGNRVDNENTPFTDGDAFDCIADLREGNELSEGTLRAFANWAARIEEQLSWAKDNACCAACHGPLSQRSAMCLADCSTNAVA